MAESVYKVITLVGTSPDSWERAAAAAVERAAQSLRDLRVAEVIEQDLVIEGGKVTAYRTQGADLVQVRGRRLRSSVVARPDRAISLALGDAPVKAGA